MMLAQQKGRNKFYTLLKVERVLHEFIARNIAPMKTKTKE